MAFMMESVEAIHRSTPLHEPSPGTNPVFVLVWIVHPFGESTHLICLQSSFVATAVDWPNTVFSMQ